jgi:hypothetical protein
MAQGIREQRRALRAEVDLECVLYRQTGSPVRARTVDVGPGGMSVTTTRPLAADELLTFDLPPARATPLTGHARVLRQQGHDVYALRFEHLPEAVRAQLERISVGELRA